MSQAPKPRSAAPLDAAAVDTWREGFAGRLIQPDDPGYDAARRVWNAEIDRYPALIAICSGTADVVRAVRFGRENDLLVAVRSGGHNVAGRGTCDDGLVIDLSAMKGVFVDPASATVRVQPGATLGDIDRETDLHDLAVPTGVAPPTGIAGLALGGGVGWLTRKHRLTCDNLLACEVVTAGGEVLTASATSHPDLFWGLRGGGGNFGIVTSLLFRAHRVGTVLGGPILWPRDQAGTLLRHYRAVMAEAPDELTADAGLFCASDGTPVAGVMACHCGDPAEGERQFDRLRAFGPPLLDMVQPRRFAEMQTLADLHGHLRTRNHWRSAFLEELSDAAIDLIVEHGNRAESPLAVTVVQVFGGAVGRIAETATAFPHRKARCNVGIEACWLEVGEDERHRGWARAFSEALHPHATGAAMLNFLGDEGPDATRRAFGVNHERLVALKTRYDPENFFCVNQNVRPATA